jgi:hypothetical protein
MDERRREAVLLPFVRDVGDEVVDGGLGHGVGGEEERRVRCKVVGANYGGNDEEARSGGLGEKRVELLEEDEGPEGVDVEVLRERGGADTEDGLAEIFGDA